MSIVSCKFVSQRNRNRGQLLGDGKPSVTVSARNQAGWFWQEWGSPRFDQSLTFFLPTLLGQQLPFRKRNGFKLIIMSSLDAVRKVYQGEWTSIFA